jgi:hypothetical protein
LTGCRAAIDELPGVRHHEILTWLCPYDRHSVLLR